MRKRTTKNYFNEIHEQAVIDYKYAENLIERDRIFTEILEPVFTRMIESILNRYKLYDKRKTIPNMITDCLSFLHEKIGYFDENKRTCRKCKQVTLEDRCALCGYKVQPVKAYSFFGTIVRRYLIGERNKSDKEKLFIEPTDSIHEEARNRSTVIIENSPVSEETHEYIQYLIKYLNTNRDVLCEGDEESEIMLSAVILFLDNPSSVPIYNKKAVYILIKELTGIENTTILTAFFKKLKVQYGQAKYLYYNPKK